MGLRDNLKNWIRLTYVFRVLNAVRQPRRYREWLRQGQPDPPPPLAKHAIIREYAKKNGMPVFVETGTFLGDTVQAMLGDFETLISIELSEKLYRKALKRFAGREKVSLFNGDSGEVLARILPDLTRPALFWLDAHFSSGVTARGDFDTPLYKELDLILNHPLAQKHVILIDDARFLNGRDGYPSFEGLRERVTTAGLKTCEIRNDIARIHL